MKPVSQGVNQTFKGLIMACQGASQGLKFFPQQPSAWGLSILKGVLRYFFGWPGPKGDRLVGVPVGVPIGVIARNHLKIATNRSETI